MWELLFLGETPSPSLCNNIGGNVLYLLVCVITNLYLAMYIMYCVECSIPPCTFVLSQGDGVLLGSPSEES